MKNKKYLFFSFVTVLLAMAIFFSLGYMPKVSLRDILANVANIDISSLKQWQQNSGFNKNLSLNDKNSDVSLLQKALSTDPDIYSPETISNSFSQDTKKAVILFQKENNLPLTGVFDTATRNKLNSIFYGELCPVPVVEYPDYTNIVFSKADTLNKLPDDFIPKDLKNIQDFNIKSVGGAICLRLDALSSLKNMFDDAKKVGIKLAVTSGFRKMEVQEWLVNYYVSNFGPGQLNGVALPGYSEHQLGTAVDLTGSSVKYKSTDDSFKNTAEYKWLAKNASKYGFYLSYPIGNPDYEFEPWHWRFWGIKE